MIINQLQRVGAILKNKLIESIFYKYMYRLWQIYALIIFFSIIRYSLKSDYSLFINFFIYSLKIIGLFIIFRPSVFTIHYFFGSLFTIHYKKRPLFTNHYTPSRPSFLPMSSASIKSLAMPGLAGTPKDKTYGLTVFKTRTKRIGEARNCLMYSFYFAS